MVSSTRSNIRLTFCNSLCNFSAFSGSVTPSKASLELAFTKLKVGLYMPVDQNRRAIFLPHSANVQDLTANLATQ
jgi:hypothetical protein